MPNPIIKIHNAETNEVIEREMTDAEFEQHKKDKAEQEARMASIVEAEKQKATALAKLEALGLSAQDLKALGL